MNILITSVGRRGYIVKYFKDVLGSTGKVHVSNSSRYSPAFSYADAFVITPLIYDNNYISFLKKYCLDNEINAIISLFDIDLLVLSKHKKEFSDIGINVLVSSENVIETCNDKWKSSKFFIANGFCIPKTYIRKEDALEAIRNRTLNYPLILKPRWGMGSNSIFIADNEIELEVFYQKINKQIEETYLKYESAKTKGLNVLIQEKLEGQEYGADIINDLEGNFANCIIKKKLSMRAGETDCAVVIDDSRIYETGKHLANCLQHIANLDVDMFICNDRVYILEMNARFGGGYPFSHIAGVDLPRAIISWLKNEKIDDNWLTVKCPLLAHKDILIKPLDIQ